MTSFPPRLTVVLWRASHPFFMWRSLSFQGERPRFWHHLARGFPFICCWLGNTPSPRQNGSCLIPLLLVHPLGFC